MPVLATSFSRLRRSSLLSLLPLFGFGAAVKSRLESKLGNLLSSLLGARIHLEGAEGDGSATAHARVENAVGLLSRRVGALKSTLHMALGQCEAFCF